MQCEWRDSWILTLPLRAGVNKRRTSLVKQQELVWRNANTLSAGPCNPGSYSLSSFTGYLCVSGVFSATGSCVHLRHALLLFAAARLTWWPHEPRGDCLARLSASWLWAEPSGDNVYQIPLLSHTLCIHAAARRRAFFNAPRCPEKDPLFTCDSNSKHLIYWCFRMLSDGGGSRVNMQPVALTGRCWNTSSVFCWVYFGGCVEQTRPPACLGVFLLVTWTSTLPWYPHPSASLISCSQ